jgi:uncharacterized protein with PIN domain
MVVDTSIILSIFFDEEHSQWAANQLNDHIGELYMSTVNLAETLIRIKDRQPTLYDELEARILSSGIQFEAPDIEQARIASLARLRYPINLGDCFVYALAVVKQTSILTLDSDFKRVDQTIVIPN